MLIYQYYQSMINSCITGLNLVPLKVIVLALTNGTNATFIILSPIEFLTV